MKNMKKGRLVCVALIAAALVVTCLIGIGKWTADAAYNGEMASSDPESILSKIPAYTHTGNLVNTFNADASGWYYTQDSTENTEANIDPLLEGKPIVDELGGGMILVYKQADEAGYTAYREDLEAVGYKFYNDNNLGGNLFATYVTETEVVTLSYIPNNDNYLSILVEPMRDLPGLKEENVYENLNVPSSVTMMTCRFVGKSNGQCILIQLCDGSFIISDAGFGYGYHPEGKYPDYVNHYQNQAKEIYDTMMTLLPAGQDKPVIAGWFFSHPHWDHMGGLITFADLYADDVVVEKFILNHPDQDTIQKIWRDNQRINISYVRVMQDAIAKFDGAAMVEAHTGQTFYMRNAEIDILSTWELLAGYKSTGVSMTDANDGSVVLDVKLADERMILFGDAQGSAVSLMGKMYDATFLKSDFVQTAHHGYNNLSTLYQRIDADVALWTATSPNSLDAHNACLADLDIYAHGNGLTYIPLPYSGDGTKEVWDGVSPIHGCDKVLYWDAVNPIYGRN